MKCPYCDVEMIPGFLNCGNTIWSERKHKISTLPGGKEKYALHLEVPMLSPHHIESVSAQQPPGSTQNGRPRV